VSISSGAANSHLLSHVASFSSGGGRPCRRMMGRMFGRARAASRWRCRRCPGTCQVWWWSSGSRHTRCSASSAIPPARASCWRRSAAARPAPATVGLRGARRSCWTRRHGTRWDGRRGTRTWRHQRDLRPPVPRGDQRLLQATDACPLDIGLSNL
jgi:hypothetical protein